MPREGIGRFAGASEYSDVEFLEIFKGLLPYVKSGKIDLGKVKDIDVVEKMDSAFCHFGINDHGVFFIETSNSGEVTVDNYRQKFSNEYFFGDFKASFESLLQNAILQNALKKIHAKFGPIRYDAEIFPVLTHTGDESGYITFVATRYDRNKFGKNGAFVVFKSWTKDENAIWKRPDPKTNVKLITAVETADSADWRIYTNEKHAKLSGNIEFNIGNLDEMLSTEKGIDEAITVLKSRANTTMKAHLKNAIRDVKDKMQGVVDAYAEKTSSIFSKTGDKSPIEGVVLRLKQANGDIFEVKGTSKAFDELKKQTWATRMDLGNLEAVTDGRFLKDAIGLNTAQPAALNNAIKKLAQSFTTDEKDAEKKELQFIFKLYESLKDNNAISSPEETKKKVNDVFESAKTELTKIVDAFKANEKNMDPDTRRKSMKAIEMVINKFQKIEGAINAEIPLEAFPLYILKFFLDRRLNTYAATHMNKPATDFSKYYEGQTPVILWNGRAQPWHRGHDAMIQLAKDRLKDVGAAKVLIFIVKGDASSKNKEENPLNEAEQKQLIEAIYKNDSLVAVAPVPLPTSTSTAIWARIEPLKMYVAGWLAGEDRLQDYKKDIDRFNANMWIQDHATLPLKVNDKGTSAVEFIQTPRVMSGTEARSSAKTADFKTWISNVCPAHALKDKEVIAMYNDIYKKLNANKMESVHEMVLSKFTRVIVEADPVTTPPSTPPAPPAPPTTPPAPTEEPTKVFSNEVIALADTIDKDRKLTVEDLDKIIKKLESEKEPEMPIKPGTAGDAVDTDKKKQEATKKLEDKLKSITVSGVDSGTAEQMKKIVLQQAQKGQKPDLKSVQDGITAENNKFDHTDQTNKAIEEILGQAQAELAPASALGAEFNSKKYDTILRKSFNENMNGVITELDRDVERGNVIQSVIDMIKKDPANKSNVIEALKYLKSEAEKKAGTPPEPEATSPTEPEAPEDFGEDKKPGSYGWDPSIMGIVKGTAGAASSMVMWIITQENDKAAALLKTIGGNISETIKKISGAENAEKLNAGLKRIFKDLQDSEKAMQSIYKKIDEAAKKVGKDAKKLINDSRKNHDIQKKLDQLEGLDMSDRLQKDLKKSPADATFIKNIKKAVPNYDALMKASMSAKPDKTSETKLINSIQAYLTGAGSKLYPYLDSLSVSKHDPLIKACIHDMANNKGCILQISPDDFIKIKSSTRGGEIDTYLGLEQRINESLDSFAELVLSIKKKIDIKDLQAKTRLSKDTINNWIEYEKKAPGNPKIIKAIGNQQAQ